VEKSVKKSSFITFILCTVGFALTGFAIQIKNPVLTVLGFGVIQGIGLGFGYITPIKAMMLWFINNKGLAAGLSIAGFALAGIITNPMIVFLLRIVPVYSVFYILAGLYGVLLFVSHLLIDKPEIDLPTEQIDKTFSMVKLIFSKKFALLWLVFFLNIACGLALISQEKQIYHLLGVTSPSTIVFYCSISALWNLAGRMIMASLQDKLKNKHVPYYFMVIASILLCSIAALNPGTLAGTLTMMWGINFFFGAGFSCLPNILEQNYGMEHLSSVQGISLSAWAIAGLIGNQFALFFINNYNLSVFYVFLFILYVVEFIILLFWTRVIKKK
jgi:Major Facilitator Superfamily.